MSGQVFINVLGHTRELRTYIVCLWKILFTSPKPFPALIRRQIEFTAACPARSQMVWDRLNAKFWGRAKELAIRLAVQKLENQMRRCVACDQTILLPALELKITIRGVLRPLALCEVCN